MSKELTTSGRPVTVPHLGPEARLALDVALGVAGVAVGATVVAVRTVHRVTAPVTRLLWRPPLLATRYHPATVFAELARTGGAEREELTPPGRGPARRLGPGHRRDGRRTARPHPAGRGERRPRPDRLDGRPRRRRRARRPGRGGSAGRPRRRGGARRHRGGGRPGRPRRRRGDGRPRRGRRAGRHRRHHRPGRPRRRRGDASTSTPPSPGSTSTPSSTGSTSSASSRRCST